VLSSPLVNQWFGSHGRAGVPKVTEARLVEPNQRNVDPIVLDPEHDPDCNVGLIRMRDPPQPMPFRLPDSFERRAFFYRLALQLSQGLRQSEGDLRDRAAGLFDGRQPPVEIVGPVDQHKPL